MDAVAEYLEQNRERLLDELKQVLRIPSISADSKFHAECHRCAEHIAAHLKSIGMTRAEVMPTKGRPVVYAEWLGAKGRPTVLLYGHYDVQPIDPEGLWKSPAFEPTVRDGNLYARGACDDKGQVYMHVAAVEAHMKVNGALPVNLKMVIEGEEESGSDNLERFLSEHRAMLDADVIVVSDTGMLSPDQPAITYGLRGMLYTQIEVEGPSDDLHSGHFGGAVMNPANALATIIAGLHDADRRITVPGFYDRVRPLSDAEREVLRTSPFDESAFLGAAGLKSGVGEKGFSTVERKGARPTLDVHGLWSGYQGEGAKTVIPRIASAKVSMRLVPDQDADDLFPRFKAHVEKLAPAGVSARVINIHGAPPWAMDPNHPMLECARRALARSWSKPPAMMREGGSIPVMATFDRTHGLPAIMMGFGLDDDNLHAPNEKFALSSYYGGMRSVAYLYEEIARGV